ncbi:MAG TPA: hypothetical protein VIK69_03860 [Methylophilaceae bacterium]|jgi:hypothetical protein
MDTTTQNHVTAYLLLGCLLMFSAFASADETGQDSQQPVTLVELEDVECAEKDGKLVALANSDSAATFEVWVDRWFMNVQTADHTKHILPPGRDPVPLGCSQTRAGNQHWSIYSIRIIPR